MGSYEYESSPDCIRNLAKLIRTHMWRKEKWTAAHHREYTLNWFSRLADTGREEAPVQSDFSYVHQPVLLNLDRVTAIFELIYEQAAGQLQTMLEDSGDGDEVVFQAGADEADRHRFLEGRILALLDLLRASRAVDFQSFTSRENEQFKEGFADTVKRLDSLLVSK